MISFIIPTLNEEKYIGETLSLISRYAGPHEIIISDTNSKDRTVEIARNYTDKIIIHSDQGSKLTIAAGRNLGASIAKGEYFVFLDADMSIMEPDFFFEKAFDCFQKNTGIVGLTASLRIFKELETFGDKIFILFFIYMRLLMNNYLGIGAASGGFQMVEAQAFRKTGGFNESLVAGEDDDFFRRLSKIGKTRFEKSLVAYHSGRREHALGWPALLYIWARDSISVWFFKKSASKEWKEIR